MEVHQLAYFESVSRHLHFTRAAEELHVAQPSVSQQIRKLESELGTPLFHRMKRQVALTEAGKTFLPHARAVLRRLDEARLEVQELSGLRKGTLSVGAPPSVGTHLLPRALAAFSRRHPGIVLTFREAGSRTLLKLLEEGELDLAVVIQPIRHPVLETLPLLEEELLLAVPRQHPLANASGAVSGAGVASAPRGPTDGFVPAASAASTPLGLTDGLVPRASAASAARGLAASSVSGAGSASAARGLVNGSASGAGAASPPGAATGSVSAGVADASRDLANASVSGAGAAGPRGRRVALAQLRDEPFVMLREGTYDLRDQTLAACRRAGFEPYVALDGGEMDSMLRFVAAGIGLAILPEMVVAELDALAGPVALRRLQPRLSRSLVLARRRDRYFSAAAREFISVLEDTARLRRASLEDVR